MAPNEGCSIVFTFSHLFFSRFVQRVGFPEGGEEDAADRETTR